MSLEKIVEEAVQGRPLEMKEAFEEVIEQRIIAALEAKYAEMYGLVDEEDLEESKDEDEEDEDEDEDDDDEDEEDEE